MPIYRRRRPYRNYNSFVIRKFALFIIVGSVFILMLTTIGTIVQSKINISSSTLKNWTANISVDTLINTLSMEIPQLQTYTASSGIDAPKTSTVLLEMITSFNPKDPRSLIRSELPGFRQFDGQFVVAGQGVDYTDFPMESSAPTDFLAEDREAVVEEDTNIQVNEAEQQPELTTGGRKVVFIYHTHNTESYLPHLPSVSDPDNAYHPEVNITKVGTRLEQELQKRGIGVYLDTTNIAQKLKDEGLNFADSYDKSREVVKQVLAQEKDLTFVFDLHRDSKNRDITTSEINGKSYARTLFLVGGRNKDYEKNLGFAEQFHNKLEEVYPGLSRGVFLQPRGHGEYNQSLFENNIVIEIGGVENSLEESYRTAEALADVIADMYWDAEKVNAQPADTGS